MSENIRDTLKQRGAAYGDYRMGVLVRHVIMRELSDVHMSENGVPLDGIAYGYIWDIVNKLSRIAVTPTHVDSWRDIAGYATLVRDQLIKESPEDAN